MLTSAARSSMRDRPFDNRHHHESSFLVAGNRTRVHVHSCCHGAKEGFRGRNKIGRRCRRTIRGLKKPKHVKSRRLKRTPAERRSDLWVAKAAYRCHLAAPECHHPRHRQSWRSVRKHAQRRAECQNRGTGPFRFSPFSPRDGHWWRHRQMEMNDRPRTARQANKKGWARPGTSQPCGSARWACGTADPANAGWSWHPEPETKPRSQGQA